MKMFWRRRPKQQWQRKPWTIDRIIDEFPDECDWMRHFVFCRFVLGEDTLWSAMCANRCEGTALPRQAMEVILFDWITTYDGKFAKECA